MALTYNAADHVDANDDKLATSTSLALPTSPTSDTTSNSTSTSQVSPAQSPSPMGYASLAQQAFTPLSMNDSDYLSDSTSAIVDDDVLLRKMDGNTYLSVGQGIVRSNSVSSTGSTTPAGRGQPSTVVGSMVQSFEALHALRASAAAKEQRDLLAKKSHGSLRAAASPPETLSPSPGPSRSVSPSPAVQEAKSNTSSGEGDVGLGAAVAADSSASDSKSSAVAQEQQPREVAPQTAAEPKHSVDCPVTVPSNVADTPLIRPIPTAIPSPKREKETTLVRTASIASINLTHPTPDVNKHSQSGVFLGNIAALEATAERLSMTSSIEDAIRQEHNELKRTESQRSSILQRARAASGSDCGSVKQLSIASRKNSILEANNAARFGGYSPGGYVMSPQTSISGASARLRSGSKTSSHGAPMTFGEPLETAGFSKNADNGEDFPFMSRHGPGKTSVRSIGSGKLSLAQIAELEYPSALTQDALDAADHVLPSPEDEDEEARIVASAHQQIDPEFAEEFDSVLTPHGQASQPMLDHGFLDEPTPRLQLHQPDLYDQYWHTHDDPARPQTSTQSVTTYDQAAFGDFDGVHCDPEASAFLPHGEPEIPEPQPRTQPRPLPPHGNRPTSYFDPMSGQEMLFYPAPVPAMLNLPPKLSKKPKAADTARNNRRSQVMSAMPMAARESRVWLPDPLEGLRGSKDSLPLMTPAGVVGGDPGDRTSSVGLAPQIPSAHARHPSEASTIHPALLVDEQQQREIRRPQLLKDADKRKSHATILDGLPPQLRASAFFDLPAQLPKIEVKGGSAMATLDSLLDASADAPVSAFTDHAYAGKLGSEVYGVEGKRKKKKKTEAAVVAIEEEIDTKPKRKTLVKKNSNSNLLDNAGEAPKRSSHFSLFGGKRANVDNDSGDEDFHRNANGPKSPNPLAPGRDEQSSEEEESEGESEEGQNVYHGPPTTLLAELQIRKQQNKLRTRPAANAFPNGMHSTLLELDAVAQVEQRARKGKRVNLAWEDPNANPDHLEDQDDEDVPLGMLAVAKAVGNGNANNRSTMDISALMSEVHRPLGLMERREIEDNEPLSRRRDRLQGRDDDQLPLSLSVMQKRMSHMPLTPYTNNLMAMRSQSRLTLPLPQGAGSRAGSVVGVNTESEQEVEGETLAARKARLAAENPLPRARPVSGMFSSELLSQFGADDETDSASKGKGAHSRDVSADVGKNALTTNGVPEEEETLGQRRRRLQAEREAREREMGTSGLGTGAALMPLSLGLDGNLAAPDSYPAPRPLSMANVLGAHPIDTPLGRMNPLEQERMRREAEAVRVQQQHDLKMAAMRAQMPQTLMTPAYGARTGGYMDGRFNNGFGGNPVAGGISLGYHGSNISLLAPQQQQQQQLQQRPASMGYGATGYGDAVAMGGYGGYGMQPNAPGQVDMVERWRQGVLH